MKQLFKQNQATTLFFNDEATAEDITDWLSIQHHTGNNILSLNEPHSANFSDQGGYILILGDEDYLQLQLEYITPINLEL